MEILRLNLILKVAAVSAMLLSYNNCTGFDAYHTDVSRKPFSLLPKKARTFEEMVDLSNDIELQNPPANYNPSQPLADPPVTYEKHKVKVVPTEIQQCSAGEWDILSAALNCRTNANILLTVKDQFNAESVLYSFPISQDGLVDYQQHLKLYSQLSQPFEGEVTGSSAHVFLCIDVNRNNRCADEPIGDLNDLTSLITGALPLNTSDFQQDTGFLTYKGGGCDEIKKGVVLFQKLHQFNNDQGSPQQITKSEYASMAAQDQLRNIESPTSKNTVPGGEVVTFPVNMVKASYNLCPPMEGYGDRKDGCFIEGTQISISKELSLPVERLKAGAKVYLADGRRAKISRIVAGPEAKPVFTFELGAGDHITVTSEHPLVTNRGLKLAREIRMGEELQSANGTFRVILGIRTAVYNGLVYNFELEGVQEEDHLVVAEGIVSGDLHLQNKMSRSNGDLRISWGR